MFPQSFSKTLPARLAIGIVASLIGVSASYALSINQTASNGVGTSGFNAATGWSSGLAPASGNDYFQSGFLLRTPGDALSYTFAGDSLTLSGLAGDPTALNRGLLYKGTGTTGTITIANLFVGNGAYVRTGSGETDLFRLAGNLTVQSTGANFQTQGPMIIDSVLKGSGTITIGASGNPTAARTITFTSGASTFNGNVALVNADQSRLTLDTTSNFNFTIGATGVNNAITGLGIIALNGAFTFDLTGAATTFGSTWTLVADSTLTETFGSTFSVTNFARVGGGTGPGTWASITGTPYQFDTTTGILTVAVPEPASYGAILGGALVVGIALRRRRMAAAR